MMMIFAATVKGWLTMPMIDATKWEEFYKKMTDDLKPYDHYDDGYRDAMDNVDDWMNGNQVEAEPVRHGPCPYCEAKTNDFVPINQSVEYSGIEIALNRQGMLRVRVYESGQETFTTQDIVEIKYCPNCGAKMGGDSHD